MPTAGAVVQWVDDDVSPVPEGWYLCDGSAVPCTGNDDLVVALLPYAGTWGRGTSVGNASGDAGTDAFTLTAHGLVDGDVVYLSNFTGGLAGPTADTRYYVVGATANTFQVSVDEGGSAVDITAAGSADVHDEINVPDYSERLLIGQAASGTAATFGGQFGAIDHVHTYKRDAPLTHGPTHTVTVDANLDGTTLSVSSSSHVHEDTENTVDTGTANPPTAVGNWIIYRGDGFGLNSNNPPTGFNGQPVPAF